MNELLTYVYSYACMCTKKHTDPYEEGEENPRKL